MLLSRLSARPMACLTAMSPVHGLVKHPTSLTTWGCHVPSVVGEKRAFSAAAAPLAAPPFTPLTAITPFPSISITATSLASHGSFAASQEAYLHPDHDRVDSLATALKDSNSAIVAHFYMDVELQSVLAKLPNRERVFVSDSLAMGDAAVRMCQDGATSIICLGVDFMSESVKSIMAKNGYGHIPVLRASEKAIGCSLAESAESLTYGAWLTKAAKTSTETSTNPLHVIYINTSLETKAMSSILVPTITCTSSNVLLTLLQSALQIQDVSVYYGPDTFMGENLVTMFDKVLENWTDEEIKTKLHPLHSRATIQKLRDNLHVYPAGNCVVHHMFNESVVKTVNENYADAYVSAHLEVPGEMFEVAMEKSLTDKGVVGSTADILNFIKRKVEEEAAALPVGTEKKNLQFVLGTEAGMVTSIVSAVQTILRENLGASEKVSAEIVFPIADEAFTVDPDSQFGGIVPGVSGGEGCSTGGGCATCPFMKMNDLDAVLDLCDEITAGNIDQLTGFFPPNRLAGKMIGDREAVDVGVDSIMHMRHLMSEGVLPEELVEQVQRAGGGRQ